MLRLNTHMRRVGWLMTTEMLYKWRQLLLVFGIGFALLMLYYLVPAFSISDLIRGLTNPNTTFNFSSSRTIYSVGRAFINVPDSYGLLKYHITYFPLALYGIGLLFNSILFSEYGDTMSRRFHLSLPASIPEKWGAKVILSLVVFPLAFLLLYQLYALITYQWGALRGMNYVRLSLLDPLLWHHVGYYLLYGGIFFGLASCFKKYGIVKVVLFFIGIRLATSILMSIIMIILLPDFDTDQLSDFFSLSGYRSFVFDNEHSFKEGFISHNLLLSNPWILGVVAILSLILSYLKYQELEA